MLFAINMFGGYTSCVHPLEVVMALYSHSRLESFGQCRLKYKFTYIDRIRREEESIEAFLGRRFHETMEKLYAELPFRTATADDLKVYFSDLWEKNFGDQVYIIRKERAADDYRRIGLKAIEDYCRRYRPFDEGRTLGTERRLMLDLDGDGRHRVQCLVDRLVARPDGTVEIHDYKTGGTLPEQSRLDKDRQLALYEMAVRSAWPDIERVELVWHFVAFDVEMRSRRSPDQLEDLRKGAIALIDEIEAAGDFPPSESSLCPWCPFEDICPLFSHKFRTDALPANEYALEDGVALVNRYTELEAKRREIKAELGFVEEEEAKIRDAAIALAERIGDRRLFGADHKLTIRSGIAVHYPKSGEDERKEFEARLKETGLWDRVADVSWLALHGIAKREHWLRGVPPELAEFVTVEPVKRVTLSKRHDVEEE